MLLGKDKAHFFNEFIRGASLLDENEHGFLSKVETVSDDELYIFIEEFEDSYKKFMDQFKATSLYNTFEKILETGRTKIFIWRDGEYQQIDIDENDQKILPWAGEIHVGGPKPSMIGIVGIAKDYNIVFGQNNNPENVYSVKGTSDNLWVISSKVNAAS